MAIAQGINKTIAYKKQSGLGVVASGSGGQLIRRETVSLNVTKDTTGQRNRLAPAIDRRGSRHCAFGRHDQRRAAGSVLSGLPRLVCAPGMGRDDCHHRFVAHHRHQRLELHRDPRNRRLPTGGIKIGDVIRLSGGSPNANNITKNPWCWATATVLTVNVLNRAQPRTAEGPIASCTVTVQGKRPGADQQPYQRLLHVRGVLSRHHPFGGLSRSAGSAWWTSRSRQPAMSQLTSGLSVLAASPAQERRA